MARGSSASFTDGRDPTVREPGLPPEFPDQSIDLGDRMDPNNVDLQSPGRVRVTMNYRGTTLTVAITDLARNVTANQTSTVDIPAVVGGNFAYVGFTAGTGGFTADQDVNAWIFQSM